MPTPLHRISCGIESERETAPVEVASVPAAAVVERDLTIEPQCRARVEMRRIFSEMFSQQRNAQTARDGSIPDRAIHLAVAQQGVGVQVARTDGRPGVIDHHELAVHIDIAAFAPRIAAGNPDEREALVSAEPRHAFEKPAAIRIAARSDRLFRIGRDQNDDFDAALQRRFECGGDRRYRDGLVLDVNRLSCRVDRKQVLVEDRSFPSGNVIRTCAGARGSVSVQAGVNVPLICTRLGPRGAESSVGNGNWSAASWPHLPSANSRSLASFQRWTKLWWTSVAAGPLSST